MKIKYPPIEPYQIGYLPVAGGHELYWEESGNLKGRPVIFLHGGPGSGTEPSHRSFFNPSLYRIVLMDQRGCGKSRPHSSLHENTTWHLVADIEALRKHLQIDRWVVFGGSWGSTLSLAYAETHPDAVLALILRGIFLCRPFELHWFYQFGAHLLFPDAWERYLEFIPKDERHDLIQAYYRRLTDADPLVRKQAALAWSSWEGSALKLLPDSALLHEFTEEYHADAIARIECHYFIHKAFFQTDNWLLEQAHRLRHLPGVIVQGRYDIICPLISAWDLHKAWPKAELEIIPNAGHSASEPGITDALIRATDRFAR
jgi:proline iminopeptidase